MCGWTGHFGVKIYLITDEQDLQSLLPAFHLFLSQDLERMMERMQFSTNGSEELKKKCCRFSKQYIDLSSSPRLRLVFPLDICNIRT